MTTNTLQVHVAFTMATADGNFTRQSKSRERLRQHPKTMNVPRLRQVHDGVNKMNCNAAGCKQSRYEEISN